MMNRREFTASMAAASGLFVRGRRLGGLQTPLRVNGDRLIAYINQLAEFGKNPVGGVSRVAYSDEDLQGREYVTGLMRAAGLNPTVDLAGNILGRLAGSDESLPPLMFGSHIDSVPEGGNYDGPLGSLSAIEAVQTLVGNGVTTRHPLEVAIFQNEEGGKTGSRAMIGEVKPRELDLVTHSGKTIREGIAAIGGDPDRLSEVRRRRGDVAAFLELHVEQGGVLDHENLDIGVVEGIVGIKRWNVTVAGIPNHAGTTPMDVRHDALLAAGRLIDAVNRVVRSVPGRQVGTVGRIEAMPGAPNVIPGRVELSLEIRDLDMEKIDRLLEGIGEEARAIGEDTGTSFAFDEFYVSDSALADEMVMRAVEQSSGELGLTSVHMPSGAGHDAQSIAKLAPMGMIFVPSEGGISHSPLEYTSPEDLVNGANVLLNALLKVDRAL
jgi:N-carbamoyl-L-amino-acid hydrolase